MAQKSIRVQVKKLSAAIAATGGTQCVPSTQMDLGCSDPGHCTQHPLHWKGEAYTGLLLPEGMSGREAHRRLAAAGLVGAKWL